MDNDFNSLLIFSFDCFIFSISDFKDELLSVLEPFFIWDFFSSKFEISVINEKINSGLDEVN